ncbi:Na-Ca exchanger/integrin-beta4 [Amycolatopsis vancoresmycina DSM 44592]|uniref:Na-Ca exchanger/integrin-beta4 n=1 Tax=Amycolatopsis vancoresmycina DSM 44592 TaxID=1292037 RepID=R1I529_9PSEU|nr:Na-Ca exchanger/integrin-beta4 [Amycolatopsis vancoresmycina DSM 44592]
MLAAVVLLLGPGTAVPAGAVAPVCGPASVAVTDQTLYEGTPAAEEPSSYTTFTFTVSVTAAAGCVPAGSVAYKTEDGSPGATSPADYVPAAGRLSWTGDSGPRTVAVQVVKDAVREPNEPFLLRLSDPVGLVLADDLAAGGIVDDDGGDGPAVVVSTDGGKICWRVCTVGVGLGLGGPAKAPVTVHYRTLPLGTGEPAYVPVKDATVTIPPGASGGSAVVELLDGKPGQRESRFVLELFAPSAGTLGNARTEVTIKPGA